MYAHVFSNMEAFLKSLLEAASLKETCSLITQIWGLGDFYGYQITSDLVEIGLLKFR